MKTVFYVHTVQSSSAFSLWIWNYFRRPTKRGQGWIFCCILIILRATRKGSPGTFVGEQKAGLQKQFTEFYGRAQIENWCSERGRGATFFFLSFLLPVNSVRACFRVRELELEEEEKEDDHSSSWFQSIPTTYPLRPEMRRGWVHCESEWDKEDIDTVWCYPWDRVINDEIYFM